MKYRFNLAVAVFAGAAMIGVAACTPTTTRHGNHHDQAIRYDCTAGVGAGR